MNPTNQMVGGGGVWGSGRGVGRIIGPDIRVDELDGVARGVSAVDRPTALLPAVDLLDLDLVLAEPALPALKVIGLDSEGDVAGAGWAVGGDHPPGLAGDFGVEDQQDMGVTDPETRGQLGGIPQGREPEHIAVERVGGLEIGGVDDCFKNGFDGLHGGLYRSSTEKMTGNQVVGVPVYIPRLRGGIKAHIAGKGIGMHATNARGFTMPTLKVILAVVFAVGGVGIAGYTLMGPRGQEKRPTAGSVITAVDDEGNAVDPSYSRARSGKQLEAVSEQIAERVRQLAPAVDAIAAASGIKDDSVARTTIDAIVPLLSGDHDSFVSAVLAMGGKIGDLDGEHPLFTHLSKLFKHASVDVDRITVAKYTAPQGGRMGVRREVVEEAEQQGGPARMNMNERIMQMKPASLFPDAPGVDDQSAIEVRIPMKPAGEDAESIFSLILTWNKEVRLWQPATYGVIKRELTVEDDG